eukprot:CAMPEP_0195511152 /NCGR_PEP_ID=MMETSP0794_2-20130614/3579_1 /TAXON_ID=515487 /ORGANISM="Stephanopyxis turris, Strain CCMP 815" /LENGTH=387 /DNA_ID=CAMNT_0040638701 /DNA_START=78 /DNA_END=1241 /DNA_ORIENTATION=-
MPNHYSICCLLATFLLSSCVQVEAEETSQQVLSSAADAAAVAADKIRSLTTSGPTRDGSGTWGDLGDLMGLLVRLPFHDAATYNVTDGGSDGCVDLDSPENNGLQEAIDLLEPIRLGTTFGSDADDGDDTASMLSRADVWALAGNVMIEAGGGPTLDYKIGRVDADTCAGQASRHVGSESTSSEEVSRLFVDRLGFTPRQVVALMGAHVLGRATTSNSGYEGKWVKNNDAFTNDYFIDLIHVPWIKQRNEDENFGRRTTWKRFNDDMFFEDEIMLQTDVDLAFQTTGGYFCSRVGGQFSQATSCPNATHAFSSHVRDFALDQEAWFEEFAVAWANLTSMTNQELSCVASGCKTPSMEQRSPTSSATREDRAFVAIACTPLILGLLLK